MEQVCSFADEHGYILKLRVEEFGPPDVLSMNQLVEFYSKFGFEVDVDWKNRTSMTRKNYNAPNEKET